MFGLYSNGGDYYICRFGNNGLYQSRFLPQTLNDKGFHTIIYSNRVYEMTDLNLQINVASSVTYTPKSNAYINIFRNNNTTPNGKIKSYIHKRNGQEIVHLIPCYRKSDNEIGMYDTVNDTFYTNQGTGNFTKGPEV